MLTYHFTHLSMVILAFVALESLIVFFPETLSFTYPSTLLNDNTYFRTYIMFSYPATENIMIPASQTFFEICSNASEIFRNILGDINITVKQHRNLTKS